MTGVPVPLPSDGPDEAVVAQLLGTLAKYDGHFGPRDARNYAASVLDMARGRRGITPEVLVRILELCPNGRWHFVEACPPDCARRLLVDDRAGHDPGQDPTGEAEGHQVHSAGGGTERGE